MRSALVAALALACLHGCLAPDGPAPDELLIVGARVYTLAWDEPARDGTPAANAPHGPDGWRPDAEAVLIVDGAIAFVGGDAETRDRAGPNARVLDARGATVLPGLIESHTHVAEMGRNLTQVNLVDVANESEAVARVAAHARDVEPGTWILGFGWDEGAWANHYPTMELLSEAVPDHPVVLRGLHGFAVWGNRLAFERAGITASTTTPRGGKILVDERGDPTGTLLNRATPLLVDAVPAPSLQQRRAEFLTGMEVLAQSGYVAIHEAGVGAQALRALESLAAEGALPIRVYAMLSAREPELMAEWLRKGPRTEPGMLTVRAVKAYYDGALGSRGALLLRGYADRPGQRGVAGQEYGFDEEIVADMMRAGFQVAVHAIGDAGNRKTLDFIAAVAAGRPDMRSGRHRIEHAQVVHPDDIPRFAQLGVIASMEPPHAMEDKAWALQRLGPERIRGAYAWRTLRQAGARQAFNSDLPGSDHGIFYGLHSAITRRGMDLKPPGGWYPEQCMTPEEAVRGYTSWGAYAGFDEERSGAIAAGYRGDLTILDIDPFVLGERDPAALRSGRVLATIVGGRTVYLNSSW